MNVRIERIDETNVWDVLKLHVSSYQENFVASNTESIVEAYTTLAKGKNVFPFAIYDKDTLVGFVMIGYDIDDSLKVAKGNYSMWRLMIDEKYQNKGYGRKTVQLALDFIRTFPCGKAEYCYLSYEPENTVAKNLYHQFGFEENGEMDDDEVVAILKL